MTPEELDKATADEAWRLLEEGQDVAIIAARLAREQEQERARVLVEPAEAIVNRAVKGTGSNDLRWPHILKAARRLEEGLNAYKAGKAAQ
jgi:thiamine pyrophosphate-dependent acetolactate synthase large subunit-like protein